MPEALTPGGDSQSVHHACKAGWRTRCAAGFEDHCAAGLAAALQGSRTSWLLLRRAYGKSSGSGYAPPKARSHPAAEGHAPYAEEDEDREDVPLVNTRSSGLDSFFSQMENSTHSSV